MGRPLTRRPRRGLSRRDFLRRASWLPAAAVGAAPLAAAMAGSPQATSDTCFVHGIASGDPLSDRIVFWTRISGVDSAAVDVMLEVSATQDFNSPLLSIITQTGPDKDYTVKLDVDGLSPATTVYYRFVALGQYSPVGRSRTLPVGTLARLRLAVVSCSSLPHGYFNAYARIAERADLDAVLHLGDYIYEYGQYEYGTVRPSEPAHEIVTLQDYRQRHAQYKADPDLQALHRQHPVIAIWDDHETANNAWYGGAENHQDSEGSWDTRVSAALQAYYEWLPVRVPGSGDLRDNYRRFDFGNLLDLHMLETRLVGRYQQLETEPGEVPVFHQTGEYADPEREMLGSTQQAWLASSLAASGARWHLIGQGVMMAQLKLNGFPNRSLLSSYINPDQWDGYDPARQRLFDLLGNGSESIDNVVVLTGDIHSAWASDLTPDPNNPRLATGGYDPVTGEGSRAVELVTTSVTSPALESNPGLAQAAVEFVYRENPHIKYSELTQKGYLLLDIDPRRLVAEFWTVDTVATPSSGQTMSIAFATDHGQNHLRPAEQTRPKRMAPPLAG